jgi:hypothetical protein
MDTVYTDKCRYKMHEQKEIPVLKREVCLISHPVWKDQISKSGGMNMATKCMDMLLCGSTSVLIWVHFWKV